MLSSHPIGQIELSRVGQTLKAMYIQQVINENKKGESLLILRVL